MCVLKLIYIVVLEEGNKSNKENLFMVKWKSEKQNKKFEKQKSC